MCTNQIICFLLGIALIVFGIIVFWKRNKEDASAEISKSGVKGPASIILIVLGLGCFYWGIAQVNCADHSIVQNDTTNHRVDTINRNVYTAKGKGNQDGGKAENDSVKVNPKYFPLASNDIPLGIKDPGFPPRFKCDVNNDGILDFGRVVGNAPNLFLSFQLGTSDGKFDNDNPYGYNSKPIDLGYEDRDRFMEDVNGDGYLDYCRYVGNPPALSALLGKRNSFSDDQFYDISLWSKNAR